MNGSLGRRQLHAPQTFFGSFSLRLKRSSESLKSAALRFVWSSMTIWIRIIWKVRDFFVYILWEWSILPSSQKWSVEFLGLTVCASVCVCSVLSTPLECIANCVRECTISEPVLYFCSSFEKIQLSLMWCVQIFASQSRFSSDTVYRISFYSYMSVLPAYWMKKFDVKYTAERSTKLPFFLF